MFVPEDQAVDGGLLPDYRRLTRLYCMNGGHHLQILADGSVQGQRDDGEAHSKTAVRTLHPGQAYNMMRSLPCTTGVSGSRTRQKDREREREREREKEGGVLQMLRKVTDILKEGDTTKQNPAVPFLKGVSHFKLHFSSDGM